MKKINQSGILGIIGGMGPLSDVTFLKRLHKITNARGDRDYLPVLYDGNCLRPDRSDYLTGKSKSSPRQSLYFSLRRLENAGANVIVMPCNTAHFWYPYLYRKKRKRTIMPNMIYESSAECQRQGYGKVCLLATEGTYSKKMYDEYFFSLGVDLVLPDATQKERVRELILKIKQGEQLPITELEKELCDIKCDAFLLGCTELSHSLSFTEKTEFKYVDALECLVKRVHTLFGKKTK
jgi:aspartate racemase